MSVSLGTSGRGRAVELDRTNEDSENNAQAIEGVGHGEACRNCGGRLKLGPALFLSGNAVREEITELGYVGDGR